MMKIGVIAANGKVGRLIVKEALERGMDVTAIVRSANKTEAKKGDSEGYHGSDQGRPGRI